MTYSTQYLGKSVTVIIDRPLGSKHPSHRYFYPVNYGYIQGEEAPDGENLDAYVLDVYEPVEAFTGKCIAVIHRIDDEDDKLVVVPDGAILDEGQIRTLTKFQERFFTSSVIFTSSVTKEGNRKHATSLDLTIREARDSDYSHLAEILSLNGQFDSPEVEGPESMRRVRTCTAAIFFVAERSDRLCGFLKAVYDGSRAMIHLLSVHPECKGMGVGTSLVRAAEKEFQHRGAPSLSVTVTDDSAGFWEKRGFSRLPVFLMLKSL